MINKKRQLETSTQLKFKKWLMKRGAKKEMSAEQNAK